MARHLNPNLPSYAKNIGKFRRYTSLTQKELAEITLISESSIHKWENGQRLSEFKPLFRICKAIKAHIYLDILQNDLSKPEFQERFVEEPFRHYIKLIGEECIHTEENTPIDEKAWFVIKIAEIEYPLENGIRQMLISQYKELYKKRNKTKKKELSR